MALSVLRRNQQLALQRSADKSKSVFIHTHFERRKSYVPDVRLFLRSRRRHNADAFRSAADEPRATLNQLAGVLARSNDRRLLAEYLKLRRALR